MVKSPPPSQQSLKMINCCISVTKINKYGNFVAKLLKYKLWAKINHIEKGYCENYTNNWLWMHMLGNFLSAKFVTRMMLCGTKIFVQLCSFNTTSHCVLLCPRSKTSHVTENKFLLLMQFIAGSHLRVTVPESYNKYVGSQGWKKLI